MTFSDSFKNSLYQLDESTFGSAALELFDYQWHENDLYQSYCKLHSKNPTNVKRLTDIPFLPISFFKSHEVKSGNWSAEKIFMSSGTGSSMRSHHLVRDMDFYLENTRIVFESFYGNLAQYHLKALLPSYQEQGNSSLIAMVDHLMTYSRSGSYYLNKDEELIQALQSEEHISILIGVSFALLDLAEKYSVDLSRHLLMETGGMKGRRKEMIREELHSRLTEAFHVSGIHSEYGMCELYTQAYAKIEGKFRFPSWAKVLIRDINDPMHFLAHDRIGGVNVIDLANVDTCAFIETQDLGKAHDNHVFEIMGRFDNSDIRGCNLLI